MKLEFRSVARFSSRAGVSLPLHLLFLGQEESCDVIIGQVVSLHARGHRAGSFDPRPAHIQAEFLFGHEGPRCAGVLIDNPLQVLFGLFRDFADINGVDFV